LRTLESERFGITGTDAGEEPVFPGPATSSALDQWVILHVAPRPWPEEHAPRKSSDLERQEWPRAFESGQVADSLTAAMPVNRTVLSASIRVVMESWRAAERDLAAMPVDSTGWPPAHARVSELRASYHRLFDEYRAPRPGERVG